MALVLSRKANETICIGDDIKIHVAQIKGQSVKLAVEAPREMQVDRAEVKK